MDVEVTDDLGSRRRAWDALVSSMPLPSPFLTSSWLEAATTRPTFVLVRNGQELVGGIAVEEEHVAGVARYRACGWRLQPDHVGVVHGRTHVDATAAAIDGWMAERRAILDVVSANDLTVRSNVTTPGAVIVIEDVVPYVDVRDGWDAYVGRLSRRQRKGNRGKALQGSEGGELEFRSFYGSDAAARVPQLFAMHLAVHGEAAQTRAFATAHVKVMSSMCEADIGEVHELARGTETAAAIFTMHLAGRTSMVLTGRSLAPEDTGAGGILYGDVVRLAAERGDTEVDLLRGGAAYKLLWANGSRDLRRVRRHHGGRALLIGKTLGAGFALRSSIARWRADP